MKFTLRPATQTDQKNIRKLVRQVKINPTQLDWRRFVVAVSPTGELIGCGQVKIHQDGSSELASIAVQPDYQHEGIATTIIQHLININPPPLYLTCRANLTGFYQRFGFQSITPAEMPPYFRRLSRLARIFTALSRNKQSMEVMLLPA